MPLSKSEGAVEWPFSVRVPKCSVSGVSPKTYTVAPYQASAQIEAPSSPDKSGRGMRLLLQCMAFGRVIKPPAMRVAFYS